MASKLIKPATILTPDPHMDQGYSYLTSINASMVNMDAMQTHQEQIQRLEPKGYSGVSDKFRSGSDYGAYEES